MARGVLAGTGLNRLGVEVYDRLRYVSLTGEHLPGMPWTIEARGAQIDALVARLAKHDASATAIVDNYPLKEIYDDEAILAQIEQDARCQRLWRGDITGYHSHSEADAALCALLSQYTRDADQIERLFGLSDLVRPKWWKHASYRIRTVQFVLNTSSPARVLRSEHTRTAFADPREVSLTAYDADIEFVRDVLALLGVQASVEPRVPFVIPCPGNAEATSRYLIYIDRRGLYTCRDVDHPDKRYTLTHLYAAHLAGVAPGDYEPLPRVSLAVYKSRLLLQMGRIDAEPIAAPPLPGDAPTYAQQAYNAFALLLRCRCAYSGILQPSPFSARWAACWIPTTFDRARRGISWLIANGFLVPQGKDSGSTLYGLQKPLE